MRTIKFRGKRIDNGEWVYGCLVNNLWVKSELTDTPGKEVCHIISGDDVQDWSELEDEENAPEVISESIGQYTEIEDKNGKEIYEGDIVNAFKKPYEDSPTINEVKFVRGCWRLVCKGIGDVPLFNYSSSNIEVMGDLHSNPELLSQ